MSQTFIPISTDRPKAVSLAILEMSDANERGRGAIHTRREVVEFILDLVGYTSNKNLPEARLLEPSCGVGDFVVVATGRLLESYLLRGGDPAEAGDILEGSIRAIELNGGSLEDARDHLLRLLAERGVPEASARHLVGSWFVSDDFLLADLGGDFTHVVGNPPYVRQELIPSPLIEEYRRRFETIYDRADLYIPFIERGLSLLVTGGVLGFICSDRWLKNRYGGPLRRMISRDFHLRHYVDMVGTPAFVSDVSAYPGIFVIARERGSTTRIARKPDIEEVGLQRLAQKMQSDGVEGYSDVREVRGVVKGSEPWLLDSVDEVALLRRLEEQYKTLESVGCTVGIGVATGADKVYIRPDAELPVEEKRKVPIITAREIRSGRIVSTRKYVLNPFEYDGSLAAFERYPKFAAYIKANEPRIRQRHVAKKNQKHWYRTIDRIYPDLVGRPKLLIPDIKGSVNVVYDEGKFYPHHNLYFVTSNRWDIQALQAVLRSVVAEFFVAMYSVKMRGGYLRYQAQYLRRIRLPSWDTVEASLRERLVEVAGEEDRATCNALAFELFGLDEGEQQIINGVIYDATQLV